MTTRQTTGGAVKGFTAEQVAEARRLLHAVSTNAALKVLGLTKRPTGHSRFDILLGDVVVRPASSVYETSAWIDAGCEVSQ
jgi:hypothetical protein